MFLDFHEFFFFKQRTAYEMRISDWSSDVCSSDLLLRYRQSWGVILSRFFLDPVWWLFVSWLPIYLAETFGFDVKQIGLFAWVPFVGAMLGSLFGGWFAGRFITRGGIVHKARKLSIAIGCAIMLLPLLLTIVAGAPLTEIGRANDLNQLTLTT